MSFDKCFAGVVCLVDRDVSLSLIFSSEGLIPGPGRRIGQKLTSYITPQDYKKELHTIFLLILLNSVLNERLKKHTYNLEYATYNNII